MQNITFTSEVIRLDADIQQYIIAHELLHIAVPNHGKLWKSLMRAHLGPYEEVEGKLAAMASPTRRRDSERRAL